MILNEFRKRRVGIVALCSYGRSGTTFFMQVLRAAGVTVTGEFPFEQRTAQVALLHWLRHELSPPADGTVTPFERATLHNATFASPVFAGASRYEDVVRIEATLADDIAAAAIRPAARWLGEKFLGFDTIRLFRSFDVGNLVMPAFLLRDPRDVFLSIKRFNARRGHASFNDTGDDASLLRTICEFQDRQVREQSRIGGMLLRYEDFMSPAGRDAALRTLAQTLNLPAGPQALATIWAQVDTGRAKAAHHITSGDTALPAHTAYTAVFATQQEALTRLGYADASPAAA